MGWHRVNAFIRLISLGLPTAVLTLALASLMAVGLISLMYDDPPVGRDKIAGDVLQSPRAVSASQR